MYKRKFANNTFPYNFRIRGMIRCNINIANISRTSSAISDWIHREVSTSNLARGRGASFATFAMLKLFHNKQLTPFMTAHFACSLIEVFYTKLW